MKRHLSSLGLAFCALAYSQAYATPSADINPTPGVLSRHDTASTLQWQAVDDDVLAQQTGKYANASMISGFVLTLLSQWQLPNGASATAQGTLSASHNALNQISASVSTQASVMNGSGNSGANPLAQTRGAQGISVNGVSQITQVAGDSNFGLNNAEISFSNAALPSLPGGNNNPNASAANAAGTLRASISFGNGGVSMALQTPAGLATQTIAPSGAQQAGAIAQLLQITGNRQNVVNQLQLSLQTLPVAATMLRQASVLQAMQNAIASTRR
ncbi:peptidase C39 [Paraburkholderia bonniea]|uniref:peptidase C39 n=1 Tax=Paraburkholderia bonniea TaxID=2152891 RepID=UPI002572A7FB|nr:peptidase C39 [Paraburkholderia bonniea]WJF91033.1 peptidase C39 [Paraburkholderia bonniea]WJF94347.1 peptidase C39 [Paraburkholderia bonniea]